MSTLFDTQIWVSNILVVSLGSKEVDRVEILDYREDEDLLLVRSINTGEEYALLYKEAGTASISETVSVTVLRSGWYKLRSASERPTVFSVFTNLVGPHHIEIA